MTILVGTDDGFGTGRINKPYGYWEMWRPGLGSLKSLCGLKCLSGHNYPTLPTTAEYSWGGRQRRRARGIVASFSRACTKEKGSAQRTIQFPTPLLGGNAPPATSSYASPSALRKKTNRKTRTGWGRQSKQPAANAQGQHGYSPPSSRAAVALREVLFSGQFHRRRCATRGRAESARRTTLRGGRQSHPILIRYVEKQLATIRRPVDGVGRIASYYLTDYYSSPQPAGRVGAVVFDGPPAGEDKPPTRQTEATGHPPSGYIAPPEGPLCLSTIHTS
uniref:Uncharacterized protein n=1 Tax=Plectus sambesii TaxID=2011161 RepID=A0A914VSB3_9BILA